MKLTWVITLAISFTFADYSKSAWAITYPQKTWERGTLSDAGLSKEKVTKLIDHLTSDKEMPTDVFLLIKSGKIVFEQYFSKPGIEHTPDKKHMVWSLTKPITGAIVGSAIEEGVVSLNDSITKYYPHITSIKSKKSRKRASQLKISHLLKMESGLRHTEEAKFRILSDAIYTYYSNKTYKDVVKGSFDRGFRHTPGTHYNYATRDPILLMGVLRQAIGDDKKYNDYPWTALFDKIGMTNTTYEQDVSGNFLGGMGIWTTAEDLARFAYLLLRKGRWQEKQILPTWWYEFMLTPSRAQLALTKEKKVNVHNRDAYGALLWVNQKLPMNSQRAFPTLPASMFYALGTNGQAMVIFPEQDVIAIRLATDSLSKKYKQRKEFRDRYMQLLGEVVLP